MALAGARARYLADKSALARLDRPQVAERLGPLIAEGAVATCGTAMLEVLYSARSHADYEEIAELLEGLPRVPIDDGVIDRTRAIQAHLARAGEHRGASLPDLLLAAAAAEAGLAVLHYDSDFDRIAAASGQPAEWVAARGTVD